MPELLRVIKQDHWTLSVWTTDLFSARKQLERTLNLRNPDTGGICLTELRTSPSLANATIYTLPLTTPEQFLDENGELREDCRTTDYEKAPPLFFENKDYQFMFSFEKAVNSVQIVHPLASVTDSFHLHKKKHFSGHINFGNSIGWFHLQIQYSMHDTLHTDKISFQVLPTKMDYRKDLAEILKIIDETYPLWRFSFAQKTNDELARSRKPHERFLLLWLAQFESLCDSLINAVNMVIRQPHTRLLPDEKVIRPEKIRRRLSARLEEKITENIRSGRGHLKYKVVRHTLQTDTPENRFVKMVLNKTVKNLSKLISLTAPDKRLSSIFKEKMRRRITPFQTSLNTPLFRQVGDYEGLSSESLVLHHRLGYAKVYRIWQELRMYLDLMGRQAGISVKTISELYEVWCFLQIRRLLTKLGFERREDRKPRLIKDGLELKMKDGEGAAFVLQRDGITIDLSHEPVFGSRRDPVFEKIFTFTVSQKPDIMLRATFPDGRKLYWIFDAKYRIDTNEKQNEDRVPEDAINQMHRYRDALLHINQSEQKKQRPVIGAYVLYPGFFDDEEIRPNPYNEGIEEVGIGAFPLLPGQKNHWLIKFLENTFAGNSGYNTNSPDMLLLSESARIPTIYMSMHLYDDLTLVAAMGPGRESAYIEKFQHGRACWYHIPEQTIKRKYENTSIDELKYIAPLLGNPDGFRIPCVYKIKSKRRVIRSELSMDQTGAAPNQKNRSKTYWLFELCEPQEVDIQLIREKKSRHFQFCFTKKSDLVTASSWENIREKYYGIIK